MRNTGNLMLYLMKLTKKHYLTAEEEIEKKRMQKEKLYKKDKMAEIMRQYKLTHLKGGI